MQSSPNFRDARWRDGVRADPRHQSNDHDGTGLDFQDFKFELFKGIDQPNGVGEPTESSTQLHFDVTGHDDDGDAVHTAINIQVNDDVPVVQATSYTSFTEGDEAASLRLQTSSVLSMRTG